MKTTLFASKYDKLPKYVKIGRTGQVTATLSALKPIKSCK